MSTYLSRFRNVAIALMLLSANAGATDSRDVVRAADTAIGEALQGDAAAAARTVAELPSGQFSGDNAEMRACLIKTFGAGSRVALPPSTGDAWIDTLASNYQHYWYRALTHPKQAAAAEAALIDQLGRMLGRTLKTEAEIDAAETDIDKKATEHGFHVLLGRTPPLRELMLWKKTTTEDRSVLLPDGVEVVRVNLLDDFVLRGWGYYATCEQRSAGGWANDEGLFAVVPAYDSISNETFNVRFVAHEGQHYADRRAFKDLLEPWELEYRGKLAEFALADESQGTTRQLICENRGDSKESSHGYANTEVVKAVTARLGVDAETFCHSDALPGQPLRDAAKALLLEDTARRRH